MGCVIGSVSIRINEEGEWVWGRERVYRYIGVRVSKVGGVLIGIVIRIEEGAIYIESMGYEWRAALGDRFMEDICIDGLGIDKGLERVWEVLERYREIIEGCV